MANELEHSVKAGEISIVRNGTVINMAIPLYGMGGIYGTGESLPPTPPPYWTWRRDLTLRATIFYEAMWAAAVGIAITKMASKGWEITSDVALRRKRAQDLLLHADGRRVGWVGFLSKQLRDFLTTDNGCFFEIERASKYPGAPIVALNHLDSLRCRRTGDPKKPVLYYDRLGQAHELLDYQVVCFSDLPDPSETYFGVGVCAASRTYNAIYKLAAIEWYLREKVSGLQPLAIHIVNGILDNQLQDSIAIAKENKTARGVGAYMGAVIVGLAQDSAPELVTIPLAELPDRFNRKEETDLAILTYADALGIDIQDIQPLSGGSLGTSQQSQILDDKAGGKGMIAYQQALIHAMNEYVMPEATQFTFVERDFRDQKLEADIQKAHAEVSKLRIEAGITTAAQEMQVLVDANDLPREFLPTDETPTAALADDEVAELAEGETDESEAVAEETKAYTPSALDIEALVNASIEAAQKKFAESRAK